MSEQPARPAPWTAWVLISTLLLLGVLILLWLTGWQFDRTTYTALQRDCFVTLNQALNTWPAALWSNLTLLGDASVLIPLLAPLILWRPQAWAAVLASSPVASLLSVTGKHLAAVPRPAALLDHQQFTIIGDILTAKNSFPSGHSLTIFAGIVALLIALAPRPLNWRYGAWLLGGVSLALTVGLSRVAVGAHWPLDVLGGAICGLIGGLSGAAIAQRYSRWWRWSTDSIGGCLLGLALAAASLSLVDRALAEPTLGGVLTLSAGGGLAAAYWLLRGCLNRFRRDRNKAYTES